MGQTSRALKTRAGSIPLPAYIPVTTFGDTYPLDALIHPYLPRLSSAIMVSAHYARPLLTSGERFPLPILVDSGGFVSLFEKAQIQTVKGLGVLRLQHPEKIETITPQDILQLQEDIADVAFTLDFPIPPGMALREARRRQKLTIANALWALDNRRRTDLPLFACIQAWDEASARVCAQAYKGCAFDGIAIGGLVPRAQDTSLVLAIVEAVRAELPELPLHVFGLGKPDSVERLFAAGVDSVDSSAYVQMAADGRLWSNPTYRLRDPSPTDRLHLALCNLATATGRTLPLSTAGLVFTTHSLHAPAAS
jgi:helicase